MDRKEIIQKLLDTSDTKNYLEIGLDNGDNFTSILASYKVGVDPIQPSELIKQNVNEECIYHAMTSDAFFDKHNGVKFDVVFVDGLHEYEQAYRDIVNSLNHLMSDGVIVVHDCKPESQEMEFPLELYNQAIPYGPWCGDVWKAIVRLRSSYNDLLVFTLDCDYGCAIVTKGNPESILPFSSLDIKDMDFKYLCTNYTYLLNLKPASYLYKYLAENRSMAGLNYSFYVEDSGAWAQDCLNDFYISEPVGVRIVENGFILPQSFVADKYSFATVYDEKGNAITGHDHYGRPDWIIKDSAAERLPQGMKYMKETVVYGGYYFNPYGHFIVDSLCRLWWFLENRNSGYKYVFILADVEAKQNTDFIDFFLMLGMREEDIVVINEPMRFESIIVPDQTSFLWQGYKRKAMSVYNAIRDSVVPSPYRKVYLSRSKLNIENGSTVTYNEEYFEDYYRSQGYEIIFPELLPIREKVAIMAGAKCVVCTNGSNAHNILFCHDGISVSILSRENDSSGVWVNRPQFWINQARAVKCAIIDASMNFLPNPNYASCSLMAPTTYWRKHIREQYGTIISNNVALTGDVVLGYMKKWTKTMAIYAKYNPPVINQMRGLLTIADLIINTHKYVIGKPIDNIAKNRLEQLFPKSKTSPIHDKVVNKINFVLFSASISGRAMLRAFLAENIKPAAFCDNNVAIQSTYIDEVIVLSPETAVKMYGQSGFFIIATKAEHRAEIKQQLLRLGVNNENIVDDVFV